MPNPKVGTVTMDVTQAIKDAKGGAVEFRVEKAGIVQAGVGKASFTEDAIVANVKAFVDSVIKAKPSGAKGNYMKKISISSTMGPGVKISARRLAAALRRYRPAPRATAAQGAVRIPADDRRNCPRLLEPHGFAAGLRSSQMLQHETGNGTGIRRSALLGQAHRVRDVSRTLGQRATGSRLRIVTRGQR